MYTKDKANEMILN